jgi:hypothetical protein
MAKEPGPLGPLLLGLVWLGITMYAAHATLAGPVSATLGAAAAGLPGVIAATLVAGASVGAAVGWRRRGPGRRLLAGLLGGALVGGALVGAAVAGAVRFGYGDAGSLVVLAIAAGVAGGALAVLPGEVLTVGLWGTTGVFLAGVVLAVARPQLVSLLGGVEAADTRFTLGQAVVAGLAAAVATPRLRHLERNRPLWLLIAGGLPGLVLLAAGWLTRAGGSTVVDLVGPADPTRPRHAAIVLAVGGLVALLVGVRRRPPAPPHQGPRPANLDTFHRGLARIGLDAGEPYGFALAGGYAVQAAGFITRPSTDLDLFTVWDRRDDFDAGASAIVDAYRAAGLTVRAERRHDTFTRLTVSDGPRTATVELGLDRRANEPVRHPVGPVLHPDDAVANKMRALYERGRASDFIDIDAVLRSGRYDRSTLLRLAQRSDITFDTGVFADALAQAERLDADAFAPYGLAGDDLAGLRHRFARWRAALLDADRPA